MGFGDGKKTALGLHQRGGSLGILNQFAGSELIKIADAAFQLVGHLGGVVGVGFAGDDAAAAAEFCLLGNCFCLLGSCF
jgi:hypothetical protein